MNTLVKKEKHSVNYKKARKWTAVITISLMAAAVMCCLALTAFADDGDVKVNTSAFIHKACNVLQVLAIIAGAGFALYGGLHIAEGHGSDNAAKQQEGVKQLVAGIGIIIMALALFPVFESVFSGAISSN